MHGLSEIFLLIAAKNVKEITSQFFEAVPKELDAKGYTDWVNANLKS